MSIVCSLNKMRIWTIYFVIIGCWFCVDMVHSHIVGRMLHALPIVAPTRQNAIEYFKTF